MSFTLLVWNAPQVATAEQAEALFRPYLDDGDVSAFEPSSDVSELLKALRRHYPEASDPVRWSAAEVEASDRVLALDFPSGVDGRIVDHVYALAHERDLLIYDPQGPHLYPRGGPAPDDGVLAMGGAGWLKLAAMLLLFAGVTWAAFRFPIGWARWPLAVIGAFLFAATLFVAVATLTATRRGRATSP